MSHYQDQSRRGTSPHPDELRPCPHPHLHPSTPPHAELCYAPPPPRGVSPHPALSLFIQDLDEGSQFPGSFCLSLPSRPSCITPGCSYTPGDEGDFQRQDWSVGDVSLLENSFSQLFVTMNPHYNTHKSIHSGPLKCSLWLLLTLTCGTNMDLHRTRQHVTAV